MNEYDNKAVDYNELEFLRANTMLGPAAALKITKMKAESEQLRKAYFKAEGELLESDYSLADEFEYEMRLRAWENKCASMWKKYGDGLGLSEFAKEAMQQRMEATRAPKNR